MSGVSSTTLFTVFSELLTDIEASQSTLRRYAVFFKILNAMINLLIGVFSIVNTVFAFTEQDPTVRKIFQVINLVLVSGLIGNFGKKEEEATSQVNNMNHVMKTLVSTMGKLGLGVIPQPTIIDTNFVVAPLPPMAIQPIPMAASINPSKDLSDLVVTPNLKTRLTGLQALIDSR